jgi:hypothetical protein
MVRTSWTSSVCLVTWPVWSIWLVSFNQTNHSDRTNHMNKTGWRNYSNSLLNGFLDFAAAETACADPNAFRLTVD